MPNVWRKNGVKFISNKPQNLTIMFKSNKYYRSEITLKNQPGILDGDLSKDSALIAKLFNEWVDENTETPENELERENIYISFSQNIDDYDRFCADIYLNGRCKSDARITKRLLKNRIELCKISINYDKQRKVKYNRLIERAENLIEQLEISMPDLPDKKEVNSSKTELQFIDYLIGDNRESIIEKINQTSRNTPMEIYIILKALLENGRLKMSTPADLYTAYYNQFSYHKSFETLIRGLDYHDISGTPNRKNNKKISNMYEYLIS